MPRLHSLLSRRIQRAADLARLVVTARRLARASPLIPGRKPVLFFNASTRLSGLSQNAAFSLLTSWIVRFSGTPVFHFVCRRGMSRCVLGTDESDPERQMPCGMCIRQSRANTSGAGTHWFTYQQDEVLAGALQNLSLSELLSYAHPLPSSWLPDSQSSGPSSPVSLPLGAIILPSLRWRLRLHNLADDESTRFLCRQFMLSAWNIASQFMTVLFDKQPQVVVVFNDIQFPEAIAAWLCARRGVRVVTHESGFLPFSGYFTEGEAVRYPVVVPPVELTPEQNARLDADLEKRWQGNFTMAGVKFWSEMHALPEGLVQKASGFKHVVSIFTNVIFDTSQVYSNVVFPDMFAWLDEVRNVILAHPGTLFILRAHPDEARPGKASRESVAMWFEQKAAGLPNVVFIPPQERLSSYDLVRMSKFVLIYNSNIGLESTLLGVPVLAAAQAPCIAYDTVFFAPDRDSYLEQLNAWLAAGRLDVPQERQRNTRRFLYYRTFRLSLPFGEFLESIQPIGYVRLKNFTLGQLARSPTARALLAGLFDGKRFELDV